MTIENDKMINEYRDMKWHLSQLVSSLESLEGNLTICLVFRQHSSSESHLLCLIDEKPGYNEEIFSLLNRGTRRSTEAQLRTSDSAQEQARSVLLYG